jgi:hypothetical protein
VECGVPNGARGIASQEVYNETKLHCDLETIVLEHLILGAFLVLPLLIVAFLFSDELWQEHRMQARQADDERPRRIDWRHPLRSMLHRH